MNTIESSEIRVGDIVEFKDDSTRWGIVTAISDCGTCIYKRSFGGHYGSSGGLIAGVDISMLFVCRGGVKSSITNSSTVK